MSAVVRPSTGLRPMTTADLEAVLAVEASAYSHPWTRGNFIDSLAAAHWAELQHDDDGALRAYYVAMPAVDELHLLNLTVAPTWQGRGHARALLDHLCGRARQSAIQRVLLEVRPSNQRAQHLYRQQGFQTVGLRKGYYPAWQGQREDAIVMSLALGDPMDPHDLD